MRRSGWIARAVNGLLPVLLVGGSFQFAAAQDSAAPETVVAVALTGVAQTSDTQTRTSTTQTAAGRTSAAPTRRCDLISSPGVCLEDVLGDQPTIWTSPFRVRKHDLAWLAPLVAATGVAYHYDGATIQALGAPTARVRFSNDFSYVGSGYGLGGAAGAIFLMGRLTHNERARETGMLALEALAEAGIVSEGIKLATDRFRPNTDSTAAGKFWPDGGTPAAETELYTVNSSFPSGHSTATWAVMHVLVDETPGHPWLHVGLYALATGVSVARVTGRDHFPSDVIAGAAIGYLLGGHVYRTHSQFRIGQPCPIALASVYNPLTRTYGIGLSVTP